MKSTTLQVCPVAPIAQRAADLSEAEIAALRQAVLEDRYLITLHAQARMGLRKITHADLKHVVTAGDVVEQYPDNRPDP